MLSEHLRGLSPKLVAVIAPMHHPYSQPLITSVHDAYSTPLGDVPIDKDALNELDEALKSDLGFGLSPVSNDPEHSLEIELPFLQRAIKPGWKLLPVMVRAQEPRVSEALGKALARVLATKNFVLVASTDLSHFYNQKTALTYDRAMLDQIEIRFRLKVHLTWSALAGASPAAWEPSRLYYGPPANLARIK